MNSWTWRIVSYVLVGLLSYYLYSVIWITGQDAPVVRTIYGDVQGSIELSRDGRPYFSYLSIPYAAVPIGQLRFEPPQPAKSWEGIKIVKEFGPLCTQTEIMATGRIQGEEDCLHISVTTPKIDPKNLLPVIFYIFGGLFMAGSVNFYKGTYFMDQDIVLVTVNYRLGALGFLSTGDEHIKGNMGMKDQQFALEWVQKNIRNFGGNPQKVTIMGESAGGASVHYHILNSKSKGLFQKAISQSGNSLLKWCLNPIPEQQAKEFGQHFNCPTQNSKELVQCLRKIPAIDLVSYHRGVMHPLRGMTAAFLPTIENHSGQDKFLSAHPLELIKNESGTSQIPWLVGVTSDEGLYMAARLQLFMPDSQEIFENWQEWAPNILSISAKGNEEALEKIRHHYFGDETKFEGEDMLLKFSRLFSDYWFFYDFDKGVKLHLKRQPMHLYYYSYNSYRSLLPLFQIVSPHDWIPAELKMTYELIKKLFKYYMGQLTSSLGACHADDVPLQFNFHPLLYIWQSSAQYQMSKEFVRTWAAYAQDKIPLSFNGIEWPEMKIGESTSLKYLNLTYPGGGIIEDPFKKVVQFWSTIKLKFDWPTY